MNDDGTMPAPPYRLVDNEATWLDQTDLVFVDPVGTGYSRATKIRTGQQVLGRPGRHPVGRRVHQAVPDALRALDFAAVHGRRKLRHDPCGGLAGHLIDHGLAFNGILLVSSILNFQTARFTTGNDLPYVLFLPTYTATAFHHKRLAPDLQRDLSATLREVEAWAAGDYTVALAQVIR